VLQALTYSTWESSASEFMRSCGFLDVAVINKGIAHNKVLF
jgi:thermostable 8-oxoguanine DNA glycosylase